MAWLMGDGSLLGNYEYGEGSIVIDPLSCVVEMPPITLQGSLFVGNLECDVTFEPLTLPGSIVVSPIYVDADFPKLSLNGDIIYYSNNLVVF